MMPLNRYPKIGETLSLLKTGMTKTVDARKVMKSRLSGMRPEISCEALKGGHLL
jgi:hypothetical protein